MRYTHTLPFKDGKWTFMKCAYWGPSNGRYIAIHEPSMRTTNYCRSIRGMFRKVRELTKEMV